MKYVKIYRRDFASGEVVGTAAVCALADGATKVQIVTDDEAMERQLKEGILMAALGRVITPNEGEAFLKALPYEFRSLHLVATDIIEGDRVE